jgi:SAM-dependent methyltransferase
MTPNDWNPHSVRIVEKQSIRDFVTRYQRYLADGRVLDFGAGQQPYRDLVGGAYMPYEKGEPWPQGFFDSILCNQVVQYIPDVPLLFRMWRKMLKAGGFLVMTYPTTWALIEQDDLWRFTPYGMNLLLKNAGFDVMFHETRAEIDLSGFVLPLGFGVVARS